MENLSNIQLLRGRFFNREQDYQYIRNGQWGQYISKWNLYNWTTFLAKVHRFLLDLQTKIYPSTSVSGCEGPAWLRLGGGSAKYIWDLANTFTNTWSNNAKKKSNANSSRSLDITLLTLWTYDIEKTDNIEKTEKLEGDI